MRDSHTTKLARAGAQAVSRLYELGGNLTFSAVRPPEPAKVVAFKTSRGCPRRLQSGHRLSLERRSP